MAGPEGERTSQPNKPTEQHKPQLERGNGAPGIQPTLNERAKPPPQNSALDRAVERERDLYERNGWVFLPLGEAGKGSPGVPTLQGEQASHSGDVNRPEVPSPKELPLPFEQNLPRHEQQPGNLDPEMEGLLRAYADGDPEEEKQLREQYKNDHSFRETFDGFRRGSRKSQTLTRSAPDFSIVLKKQENQE